MNAMREIDLVLEQVGKLGRKRGYELIDIRISDAGEVQAYIRAKVTHQTVTKWFQRANANVLGNIQVDDPLHGDSSKFVVKFKVRGNE